MSQSIQRDDYERTYSSPAREFVEVEDSINDLPPSRARSIALTKLEEAYLWAREALG